MSDILIRQDGRAGRITLNRPEALNALTWEMCLAIEDALDAWAADDSIALVLIEGAGDRAFCAGGDIVEMYRTGKAGDYSYGRRFWTDEYRLNAKIAEYPKPYIAFCQGFTMGGGVGVSCHGSHRIVSESSKISMPECGIGLIPDVGGTLLLSRAPGRLGEYLGITAARMAAGCAILAGFADHYVPEDRWEEVKRALCDTGETAAIEAAAEEAPASGLAGIVDWTMKHFRGSTLADVLRSLDAEHSERSADARSSMAKMSPFAIACAYEAIGRVRGASSIRRALEMEYRFTFRAMEHSDFIEGIRAAIIDKDRSPAWRHDRVEDIPPLEIARMLMPLGPDRLSFERG